MSTEMIQNMAKEGGDASDHCQYHDEAAFPQD
jgi:hypothetical protein